MSKIVRSVKNVTKGYYSIQVKVRNATSNDPWGPIKSELAEIAAMTFNNPSDFYEIMDMLDKRLNDKDKNWRHVLKSLKVLDYCLHEGSDLVVTWTRKNIHILKTLREFSYIDEDRRDVGADVRLRAKELVSLVLDEDRLQAERRRRRSQPSFFTKKAPVSHLNEGMGNPITNVRIGKPVNKDVLEVELLDQKLKDEHYHVAQRNPEFVDAELRPALEVSKRDADLHAAREASKIEDGQPEQEDGEHPFPAPNRTPITAILREGDISPQVSLTTKNTSSTEAAREDLNTIPSFDTSHTIERHLGQYFPPSTAEPRGSLTDNDLQVISTLLRNKGRITWSNVPRIYTVLRTIGHLELIDGFIEEGLTDFWFPFAIGSLPDVLTPTAKTNFVASQSIVITKALEFEKGAERKHAHFDRNDLIPFQVISKLGDGLHGSVERVGSLLGREYARKSFRRRKAFGSHKEDIRTFKTELQALKRISHIHCIELVGSYTDPKNFALIMTPVADCNLSTYLNLAAISQEKLTILRGFFGCLANALKYLHASQIRHRDIKPQNILVHGARVLLADFGIALDWGDLGGSTTTEDSGKTWVYAAPEVAQYQKRNSSADVWSLGCVFLEMATVLIGVKISAMRELFKDRNSDYRFYNNIDTTREWLKELSGSTPIDETRPLNWIASMLQGNADLRPSALALYNSITVCREFCGVCCREDHEPSDSPDDDDDDDPWAEDTLN